MKCQCGCGQDVPIADRTDRQRNRVKGEPLRFVHGHNRRRTRVVVSEKTCPRCKRTKPASEYYRDATRPDGLRSHCRECVKETNARVNKEGDHSRRWREANPERSRESTRKWRREHPEQHAEKEGRRRARKRGQGFEKIIPSEVYERDGGRCHICGKHVPKSRMSLDHLIPLSRGGGHFKLNVRLAHLECNVRRGAGRMPAQLLLL